MQMYGKYSGNELKYVTQALDSENIENKKNPWVPRFEAAFAKKFGVKYAIACNSGTSGLHAALVAVGVKPGDEVISPALTVVMDAFATIHVGATPVFADIDSETQNIDPEDIRRKITSKTKAIIPVSLYGLSVDMDPIMEMAEEYNITIIEDSAQTLLGKYKNRIAGTLGHIGVFSFENTKHITTGGEGGMIVTDDGEFAERARKFTGIGYKHLTATAGRTSLSISSVQDPNYERFDTLGLNYRMTGISAAIGLAQLEQIDFLVSRRQEIAQLFTEAIGDCDWMRPQSVPNGYEHSYFTYAVRYYGDKTIGVSWKEFYQKYKDMGGDGFYGAWKVPYLEPVFNNLKINKKTYSKGLCPIAEELQPRMMQFKTNYRNLEIAKQKTQILHNVIEKLGR
jgi:perosamine synthetase